MLCFRCHKREQLPDNRLCYQCEEMLEEIHQQRIEEALADRLERGKEVDNYPLE